MSPLTGGRAAADALARLRDGNRRFVSNQVTATSTSNPARRAELLAGQDPFAIILGCSDARVPAELVFDQVVGADDSLDSGVVTLLDGGPKPG